MDGWRWEGGMGKAQKVLSHTDSGWSLYPPIDLTINPDYLVAWQISLILKG
jgi:hypothetical protein